MSYSCARVVAVSTFIAFISLVELPSGIVAQAAEIKVMSSAALSSVITELTPQFERESGHKLVVQYGASATLKKQIDAGEAPDVAILTPPLIDDLAKQGKVPGDARANVARTGVGVAVRKGGPKPDISTVDAFKK